ncbi:hypothetical protein COU74_03150 [Candidatus Peregrinibacteria bacterium CG10_big_fil_rev_8_21_14_0_10_36_19]|nr:MAG: hypothetical protein COU74_03150 [Candidatus Peregrinibacteria bacterium CG10_big_fil_rev_8_21_14_0_10_36_19]
MLKRLFTSNTRIKLLTIFLTNPEEEYFIRELTRRLDEQINSIRRELDNLKKAGLLKTKTKNRKKYYYINTEFILIDELTSMFKKAMSNDQTMAKDISKLGNIKLLALSGQFVDMETESVDMLIVGDIDKDKLSEYLNQQVRSQRPVRYTTMTPEDYQYRLDCKDKFVHDIITNPKNKIPIKKI